MKCLKVDDYIQRTASVKETQLLYQELENYVKSRPGLQARTLCDRVIRACNHQLGAGSPVSDHVRQIVDLVELSLHGYDVSAALVPQTCPLYMEKIVFHIVRNLNNLEVHSLCSHVAGLLYSRLAQTQQVEGFSSLVRSCFSVLWNGLSATKDKKILDPREKLHCQIQALSFLLLLDKESAAALSSKAPIYTEDAVAEYEKSCEALNEEDASFMLEEMHTLLSRCWTGGNSCERDDSAHAGEKSSLCTLTEIVLIIIKVLCKAGHHKNASIFLNDIEGKVGSCSDRPSTALVLGARAIKIHSTMKAEEESGQALTECARALRALSSDLEEHTARAVVEGCGLVVWAVENGHSNALSGPVLLAWFSFLEEHQDLLLRILKRSSICQAESSRLQQALSVSIYQGFVFAHESMLASKLESSDTLDRVLLYCQATAGRMMTELRKLPSESLLIKAVIAVTNLACGLYNRRLYDQAFRLVEILGQDFCKNCPTSLSTDRLSRLFMLAVQSSRRAGHLERALDWVILWLKALGDNVTTHMTEPVSLWVKTKTDAARNSEEDIRLRTLRDGFGSGLPDEGVMLCLLDEELRAYKEVVGDTAQERYNTLCDLFDICHEESSHTHLRAVYLCEMAQVVCFQDFSEQTECAAVDFTHEALRLLKEEPETLENADKLKDDKAHTLLWLFICTLEKNLQAAIEKDTKLRELREQTRCVANPIGTNDFDYEDKRKSQDSIQVYEGLHFSLAAENKLCKPLERALSEWSALLSGQALPSVRNPKQTCNSIVVSAALFKLMGKPLKAFEAYKLAVGLFHQLADAQGEASSFCQLAILLLEMGSPELALAQLEQAEKILASDVTPEGPSSLSMLVILLKAQYCYSTGQVECGLPYLCEVLKEVNEQRQSKNWYLLRARALQTCSSYLSLDIDTLPQTQRGCITQHGINSPDIALYESLKLLCSLLVTLVGKGLYGTSSGSPDVRFIDQGDNLVLKWQLLTELLNCSMKMVTLRRSCGAINDARLQCLEALKLAIKLQALSQCAELLVVKAELELMQGEREESGYDLDKVKNLLELCTDIPDQECKTEVKIKPRKGRPAKKTQASSPVLDNEEDILSTRWISKEPVLGDLTSSPQLKPQPRRWLSSLAHDRGCRCPCCSEPCLGRVTARWAATQADLVLQLDPTDTKVSLKLQGATLARCKAVTAKLEARLDKLFPECGPVKTSAKPALMQDIVGSVYLRMALSGLEPQQNKICGIWKVLEASLTFIDSVPSPVLRPVKAGLMVAKAIASLANMATKKNCSPEELFSNAWTWNAPKEDKEAKPEKKMAPTASLLKEPKNALPREKTKEVKKVRVTKPKIQGTSSSAKEKEFLPVPKTPSAARSKSSASELSAFDFNTLVPTLACTPVQKVKGPASGQRAPRTGSRIQFHVFEESSPVQDKVQPVPAAPKRTKKSRFKVEFSDESDSEASAQADPKEMLDAPKKRNPSRKTAPKGKTAPDTPAEKAPPKRQLRSKKSSALPQTTSSDDEETLVRQPIRRGRTRREITEEPDKMRTIEEENNDVLDLSIEQLRTSDNETDGISAPSKDTETDLEVLRRDMSAHVERDDLFELRSRGQPRGQHTPFHHPDVKPENLSLEDVQSLLRSAWLVLHHFPPSTIYPTLCGLLALSIGQQDPITTAMLHCQSLGITSRHRTIRHLASSLKKLRKASNELTNKMDALTLDDGSSTSTEQRLSQLENIFSFPTADSSTFPQSHCQEFVQQIQHLPPGVTVCVMSVLSVKSQEMGHSIMLSRLEKGTDPITVHIPASREQHSIRWLVQEMDSILTEQKVVSCVSEKAKWWEGRRALDARVEQLLKEMEALLGCWKSFLLPLSLDPMVSAQAEQLREALSARGVTVSDEMLRAVLAASPVLTQKELRRFGMGLSPKWDRECDELLHAAGSQFEDKEETRGHVVLILDKYLQKLPWESISVLTSHSVSRMPSLHSLIGLSVQKENDAQSILKRGMDLKKAFYVLDPDANLEQSQERFKDWFMSKPGWVGVCGNAPDSGQLEEAVATKDLYIYVGHGAGARFLDGQAVLKQQMRAASLLFGCSSAALAVRGEQEGQGIILNYLIAGCPLVLGNLWDVTDRDIDRFTKALLESWQSKGSGAPLLDYVGPSRQATHLKYLIGAAPVVYGLPVHLQ